MLDCREQSREKQRASQHDCHDFSHWRNNTLRWKCDVDFRPMNAILIWIERDVFLHIGAKSTNSDIPCNRILGPNQGKDPVIRPLWLAVEARLMPDGACAGTADCQTTQTYCVHVNHNSIRVHLLPGSMYWSTNSLVCKFHMCPYTYHVNK